ncbi:MAG: large conductance mechanosensitive channel protein MscL [Actinomycetota bacterium]
MLQEFRDFINRGNVIEAAVGLIMALAFKPVIDSVVDDLIMPIVARVFSQPDFSSLKIGLGGSQEVTLEDGSVVTQEPSIMYGQFINEVVSFLIIAFVVFLIVRTYNRAINKQEEESGPTEVELLTEIRDGLKG